LAVGDTVGCDAGNAKLHGYIRSFCRNGEVNRVMAMSDQLVATLRATFGYTPERRQQQSAEHWDIIEAMRKRDYAEALAAEERHRSNGVADLLERFNARLATAVA